jgi:hypothetical protein
MLKILRPGGAPEVPPGAIKIGRATDNDIVVPDVLASRHHATLIPTTGRSPTTAASTAPSSTASASTRPRCATVTWSPSATSTCVQRRHLVRRSETEAATRTGGLEVRGLTWTIEGNKTLLDNISIDAAGHPDRGDRPVGAGKSTFARQVAG